MDTPENIPTDRRPLGFWLTAADALIRRELDIVLRDEALDRGDWRLLNALAGTVDAPGLHDRLARKPRRVTALADRGWTELVDGEWALTDAGRTALGRIGERVEAVRERVAGAVAPEDYATTIASLEAIVRAFGWQEGEPLPRPSRGRRHPDAGRHGFGRPEFAHDRRGHDGARNRGFDRDRFSHDGAHRHGGGRGYDHHSADRGARPFPGRPDRSFGPDFDPRGGHERPCDGHRGFGPQRAA